MVGPVPLSIPHPGQLLLEFHNLIHTISCVSDIGGLSSRPQAVPVMVRMSSSASDGLALL